MFRTPAFSNDNDDDDKNNDKDHQEDEDGNTTSSSPLPSKMTLGIMIAQIAQLTPKNFFGRYNLHILTILKVLLATAPAAVRSDPQLLKYVHPTRPLQNRGYDVDMEGALWKGISQCRKLQRATGGTTLLNPVYKAIKVAWYDLDLGEWPYHVQ
ncbi:hypothetical protein FRC00_014441 [Tulasnella sp. 408]|nr:hypothetical protein FRC00_014441 [Tulasnella sp. 408]